MIIPGSPEMKSQLEAAFDLEPSDAMFKETAVQYERADRVIPEAEWMKRAPYIRAINKLKKEKDAVILAHNYMTPDIYHGVADIVGDSLQLAIEATRVKQGTIIQGGVHFMAETSKILSPENLLHIIQRRRHHQRNGQRFGHHDPRWSSGAKRCQTDQEKNRLLGRCMRSAHRVQGRRIARIPQI